MVIVERLKFFIGFKISPVKEDFKVQRVLERIAKRLLEVLKKYPRKSFLADCKSLL